MREWAKRIVSTGLSLALIFGMSTANNAMLTNKGLDTVQAASAVSRQSIHDGAILHAFCWNFNTIRENMRDIADAGYTAVQTSPINDCLSTEPGLTLFSDTGKWYYHYQPTDWKIGNYQLGSRDEFKAMCDEADKYGIGIIVDIDPNHTTPSFSQLKSGLLEAVDGIDNLYHIKGDDITRNINYSDRVSVVYDPMGGLPDVDTENHAFQAYFYDFLKDCVACGADGFRIDTAKHIALPDDGVPADYAGQEDRNDFYPNMKDYINDYASKDYADLFVYGEVLQGDTARLAAYQDMLGGTTASDYGGAIRTAISSGNLAASKISSYKIEDDVTNGVTYTADSDKLVTWVESHDNYINDKSYNTVDDTDVILAWAVITAREDGTPLFFSRPNNSDATNIWGDNILGAAGSDIYKDPQVAAVNKFRTTMVGESETLRNANGNNSVLMIERGNKGVVIVNASESDIDIDTATGIADGTYINSVEGSDALFNVKDGIITGTVKGQSVVVLDKIADGDYSTLFYFNSKGWDSVSALVENTTYDCRNTGDGWWTVTIPSKDFEVVFTDGTSKSNVYTITPTSGRYMTGEDNRVFNTKEEAETAAGIITKSVYFYNTIDWSTVYAYAWSGEKQYFGSWPGISAKNEGGYWWRTDVKMMSDQNFSIIFNNGNGTQTENIDITDPSKCYVVLSNNQPGGNLTTEQYSSKDEAMNAIGIYSDKTTVYYYNTRGWENVGVYTWGDAALGEWPGKLAEYEGNNWWKLTIDAAPSADFNIIFNDYGVGSQTGNLVVDSISNVYFWGDKKFSSKAAAEQAAYDYENAEDDELEKIDGYTQIYFYNENLWNDVYVYAWGGDYNNCIGDWPGTKMTRVDGNWYGANVPTEALNNTELHLIFNNGNGTQLDDNIVSGTFSRYFTASSKDAFVSKAEVLKYLNIEEKEDEPEKSEEYKKVDEEPAVADGMTRIYYKLDSSWNSDVYMYGWLKNSDGTSAGEPLGGWPGTKMYHIGNGWHAVDIESKYLETDVEVEDKVEDALNNTEVILESTDKTDELSTEETDSNVVNPKDSDSEADIVDDNSKEENSKEENSIEESVTNEPVSEESENTDDSKEEASDETSEDSMISDIVAFVLNARDLLLSAFNPTIVYAEELTDDSTPTSAPVLQLIVNDNGTHTQIEGDVALVTTIRPSDEELGKSTQQPEDTNNSDQTPEVTDGSNDTTADKGSKGSGTTANNGSSSSSNGSSSSSSSTSTTTTTRSNTVVDAVPNNQIAIAEAEPVPTSATSTKTSKATTYKKAVAADNTEEVAAEENEEDVVEETEDEVANESTQSEDNNVEISDEEAPAAAEEETGSAMGIIVVIAVIALLAAIGTAVTVTVRRRKL